MNKLRKRILSITLTLTMLIGLIPMSSITAFAVPGDYGKPLNELQYLLATYNALPDASGNVSELNGEGLTHVTIYDAEYEQELLQACEFYKSSKAQSSAYSGKDIMEFAASVGVKISYSKDASLGIDKLFSIGARRKFNISGDYAYNKSTESYFFEFEAIRTEGTYTFNENKLGFLKQHLNADFENALYGVSAAYSDPASFFAKYGTHFVGSYTMGGQAGTYTSTSSVKEGHNGSLEAAYSSGIGASAEDSGIKVGFSSALDISGRITASYNTGDYRSTSKTYSYGGNAIIDNNTDPSKISDAYTKWANSFVFTGNGWNCDIITDQNLVMYPIWELLPDGERKTELYNAYMEMSLEQDVSFFEKYVYSMPENSLPDYSDYVIISSAEQFNSIRNGLNKKYVLACNIDLGNTEWSPIGTKNAPFTGTLDGNGNTVSGLKITKCTNGVAGLFGYNSGIIKNLNVSGSVNASGNGQNDVSFVGGIVGVNSGTISGCQNSVSVHGTANATTEQDHSLENTTDNFLNRLAKSESVSSGKTVTVSQIESNISSAMAKNATIVENGGVYTSFPLKLTGEAENVTIQIPDSGKTAYIVLENANITGHIVSANGNSRPVCIISMGNENTLTAPNDTVAIEVPNANLAITGKAKLKIEGGTGSDGIDGLAGSNGSNNSSGAGYSGTGGSVGTNAENGKTAVQARDICISSNNTIVLQSGNGGNGGAGGNGGNGGNGSNGSGLFLAANGGNGGNGGHGGAGGNGGDAATPVGADVSTITIYSGNLELVYGKPGNGGNGGTGGKGGKGGNSNGAIGDAGSGGNGGVGGQGGDAGFICELTTPALAVYKSSRVYVKYSDYIEDMIGLPGEGAFGGTGGSHGSSNFNAGSNGTDWSKTHFADGNSNSIFVKDSTCCVLITSNKRYEIHNNYQDDGSLQAIVSGSSVYEDTNLISIGSIAEQTFISELLSYLQENNYWMGLKRNASKGFNIFDWKDNSTIRIDEDTFGSEAVAVRIDNSKEEICDAFVNWADGEPSDSTKTFCYISSDGKWHNDDEQVVIGYITEETLLTSTTNSFNSNTLAVGGICGKNNGTVSACNNTSAVSCDARSDVSGISALTGGIAGVNLSLVENSYNAGAVTTLALTNSSDFFADAYAKNIATNDGGTVRNSNGTASPVADAVSSNGLINQITDESGIDIDESATAKRVSADVWDAQIISVNRILKTDYLSGDIFNRNQVVLSVKNGNASDCNCYCVLSREGNTVAVVKYNNTTRYIPVTVLPTEPTALSVIQLPKTNYIVGDAFSSEGMILELTYNNGVTSRLLPSSDGISLASPNMALTGKKSVAVTYTYNDGLNTINTSFDITVDELALTGIQLVQKPEKQIYELGEDLDTAGIVIEKIYNNGSKENIPLNDTNLKFSYDFSRVGETDVSISYYGQYRTSFTVEVIAPAVIGDDDSQMVIGTKTARAGETVTLFFELKNAPELKSIALSNFTYDSTALELIKGEWKITDSILQNWNSANQTAAIAFADNCDVNGEIFALTFKVKDGTADGNYSVNCSITAKSKLASGAEKNIAIPTISGNVNVVSVIRGDVNGDNLVTSDDAIQVLYYTLLPDIYTVNQDVDFNGDGLTTSDDAIHLLYYTLLPDLYPLY